MEEPAGLEPANSSFAGCGLTNLAMVPCKINGLCPIKWYPEPDLNRHGRNDRGILSPLCLPFHHPGFVGTKYISNTKERQTILCKV